MESSLVMSEVIDYIEDEAEDEALDVDVEGENEVPAHLDIEIKKASLRFDKIRKLVMRKIAADKNYRILKEAGTEGRWKVAAALGALGSTGLALAGLYAVNSSFRKIVNDEYDKGAGFTSDWLAQMAKDWLGS